MNNKLVILFMSFILISFSISAQTPAEHQNTIHALFNQDISSPELVHALSEKIEKLIIEEDLAEHRENLLWMYALVNHGIPQEALNNLYCNAILKNSKIIDDQGDIETLTQEHSIAKAINITLLSFLGLSFLSRKPRRIEKIALAAGTVGSALLSDNYAKKIELTRFIAQHTKNSVGKRVIALLVTPVQEQQTTEQSQ